MARQDLKKLVDKIQRGSRRSQYTGSIDNPDSGSVWRVVNKIDFKTALEREPSMDFAEFYHESVRYLRYEDAETDNTDVNAVDDGGSSRAGHGKNNGKRKANNDSG